jgi:hypothetical protein
MLMAEEAIFVPLVRLDNRNSAFFPDTNTMLLCGFLLYHFLLGGGGLNDTQSRGDLVVAQDPFLGADPLHRHLRHYF